MPAAAKKIIFNVVIDDARTEGANSYAEPTGRHRGQSGGISISSIRRVENAQIEGQWFPNVRARIKELRRQQNTRNLKLSPSQPAIGIMTAINVTSNMGAASRPRGNHANNGGMALGVVEAIKKRRQAGRRLRSSANGSRSEALYY